MTTRNYPYIAVVGQTKRAWLLRVPNKLKEIRVPKGGVEFIRKGDKKFVAVEDRVAEFVGLVDEVSL